jgi:hypothetical protein
MTLSFFFFFCFWLSISLEYSCIEVYYDNRGSSGEVLLELLSDVCQYFQNDAFSVEV